MASHSSKVCCPAGHACVARTGAELISENAGYRQGFVCDRCKVTFPKLPPTVMHCTTCQFDICCGCTAGSPVGGAVATSIVPSKLEESVNIFGMNLLRACATGQNGNTFISPYSISQILSLVSAGARGETLTEMLSTLCVPADAAATLSAFYANTNSSLKNVPADILIANSTWARAGYSFTPQFQQIAAQYGAGAYQLPNEPSPINKWCSDNTRGLIKTVIDRIDSDLIFILINALYFKGIFTKQFDARQTMERPFTLANGSEVNVQGMFKNEKMLYHETPDMQAVMLDYGPGRGGPMSCVVLLPKPEKTADQLLNNPALWHSLGAKNFTNREGTLILPKFKIEWMLDLKNVLNSLGMKTAFNNADFTGLCTSGGISISSVIHKTFVEVNEKGTEAAAVTAVMMNRCMPAMREEPFEMFVNRPFLFFIVNKVSGIILFAGKMGAPNSV